MKKSIRSSHLKLKNINVKQTKLEERAAPRMAIACEEYEGGGGYYPTATVEPEPEPEPDVVRTGGSYGGTGGGLPDMGPQEITVPSRTTNVAFSTRRY